MLRMSRRSVISKSARLRKTHARINNQTLLTIKPNSIVNTEQNVVVSYHFTNINFPELRASVLCLDKSSNQYVLSLGRRVSCDCIKIACIEPRHYTTAIQHDYRPRFERLESIVRPREWRNKVGVIQQLISDQSHSVWSAPSLT